MSPEEIKFWADVEAQTQLTLPPTIEYRIYYNELGEIYSCSMTDHPEIGTYLVVDKIDYENYFLYSVVNGKLKKINNDAGYCVQLRPSSTGQAVVAGHAGLKIEPGETYPNIEYYAYRNN